MIDASLDVLVPELVFLSPVFISIPLDCEKKAFEISKLGKLDAV